MISDPARLFLGLELNDDARSALAAVREELSSGTSFAGKLHSPSLYHLTLVFLGMVPAGQNARLTEILDSVPGNPFSLTLSALGTFKGGSILWAGVKENGALMEYRARLAHALREGGFSFEEGEYRPHITLGRQIKSLVPDLRVPEISFPVTHATLFESARVNGELTYIPQYRSVFR